MDKKELLERLDRIYQRDYGDGKYLDKEDDHVDADNAILEFINDSEITEAFDKIEKWYA
jgi:hypothetical protein